MGNKAPKSLTPDEVRKVFELKAGRKMTNNLIAKKLGCSDWLIAKTIRREVYDDVPLPKDLVEAAQRNTITRRRKKVKQVGPSYEDQARAMNLLTNACYQLLAAEEACLNAGMEKERVERHIMFLTKNTHL
jgi:IS30 family transposase